MKWLWVCGWGVDPKSLTDWANLAYPAVFHRVILPLSLTDGFQEGYDRILGWSWGGFRVLEWIRYVENRQKTPPIVLFAPIIGFCKEDCLGGKSSRIQVKYLIRWMKRDPVAALTDFYQRAGLSTPFCQYNQGNFPVWASELAHLASLKLKINQVVDSLVSRNIKILVGENDPLVDPAYLVNHLGATMVPGVGHDLADLAFSMK